MVAKRWLVVFLVPLLGTAVMSAAPRRAPSLDVRSTCHSSGSLHSQADDACMKDELGARDELVKMWPRIPANIRQTCADEVRIGGSPSYVELVTCAQMNEWSKIPPSPSPPGATGGVGLR